MFYMCLFSHQSAQLFLYKVSRLSSPRKGLLMDRCGALLLVTQYRKSAGTSVSCRTRGMPKIYCTTFIKRRFMWLYLLYRIAYIRIRLERWWDTAHVLSWAGCEPLISLMFFLYFHVVYRSYFQVSSFQFGWFEVFYFSVYVNVSFVILKNIEIGDFFSYQYIINLGLLGFIVLLLKAVTEQQCDFRSFYPL